MGRESGWITSDTRDPRFDNVTGSVFGQRFTGFVVVKEVFRLFVVFEVSAECAEEFMHLFVPFVPIDGTDLWIIGFTDRKRITNSVLVVLPFTDEHVHAFFHLTGFGGDGIEFDVTPFQSDNLLRSRQNGCHQ